MVWQLISMLVIVSAPLIIGGYDLVAYLVSGNEATISKVSLRTGAEHPAFKFSICFLFGELCVHLFCPGPQTAQLPNWLTLSLLLGVPMVTAFGSLFISAREHHLMGAALNEYPMVSVLLAMILGVLIGGAYLPQSAE